MNLNTSQSALATDTAGSWGEIVLGEERSFPRIPIEIPALYADSQGGFREDYVANLSQGGLFLRTRVLRPMGERLELILLLPDSSQEVTVQAEVVHHAKDPQGDGAGMGMMFTVVEPSLKYMLGNYLLQLEARAETGKRSAPRIPTPPAELHLQLENKDADDTAVAVLANLSRNGMLVHSRAPLTLFERIQTVLTHPDRSLALAVEGEIVHLHPLSQNGFIVAAGIRFTQLTPTAQTQLNQVVRDMLFRQRLS